MDTKPPLGLTVADLLDTLADHDNARIIRTNRTNPERRCWALGWLTSAVGAHVLGDDDVDRDPHATLRSRLAVAELVTMDDDTFAHWQIMGLQRSLAVEQARADAVHELVAAGRPGEPDEVA